MALISSWGAKLVLISIHGIFSTVCFLWSHYLLHLSVSVSLGVSIAVFVVAVLTSLYSKFVECSIWLCLPAFSCTKFGRNVLLFLGIGVLLAGPVDNIVENAITASDSVACFSDLMGNETSGSLLSRNHTQKIEDFVEYWRNNSAEIKENVQYLRETMSAIDSYVGDANRSLDRYTEVCTGTLSTVADACNQKTGSVFDICQRQATRAYDWLRGITDVLPSVLSDRVVKGYCKVVGCSLNSNSFDEKDLQHICHKFNINSLCNSYLKPDICEPSQTFATVGKLNFYAEKLGNYVNYFDSLVSIDFHQISANTSNSTSASFRRRAATIARTSRSHLHTAQLVVRVLAIFASLSIFAMPLRCMLRVKKQRNTYSDYETESARKSLAAYRNNFERNSRLWKLQEDGARSAGSLLMVGINGALAAALFLTDSAFSLLLQYARDFSRFLIQNFAVKDVSVKVFGSGPLSLMFESLMASISSDQLTGFFEHFIICFQSPTYTEGHFIVLAVCLYAISIGSLILSKKAAIWSDRIHKNFYPEDNFY